jgi:RNA polymerase sigma factor (sigma-70 family)
LGSDKYNNYSDAELINKYSEDGDPLFAGILYKRYGHLVMGLCIKYLKNTQDAEDAVMNIFQGLMTDLKRHRVQYFKSWLYVYSKNHCLMQLRKRQSSLKRELELPDEPTLLMDFNQPEHLKEKEEEISRLESAIEGLNEKQKRCIALFYLEGRSYAEIELETGFTANEVKSFIQNGKRNIRLRMEEMNGTRRAE